jgi:hypothetical protein
VSSSSPWLPPVGGATGGAIEADGFVVGGDRPAGCSPPSVQHMGESGAVLRRC